MIHQSRNNSRPAVKKVHLFFAAVFFGVLLIACAKNAFAENESSGVTALPFNVGEKIAYQVSWEMVPAGSVTLEVKEDTVLQGRAVRHFVLTARSNRFVDYFYKVRDRYDSYTDKGFTRSILYKKRQAGKEDKDVVVVFDWDTHQATYSNHGGKRDPIDIPAHTFDPLASFYKLRMLDLALFDEKKADMETAALFFPVTDGRKFFLQKGEIIRKEKITLNRKAHDCYVLVPHVNHFSGVFEKSKDPTVKVWLSADQRQIPLRITIKVFIGSVIFELIDNEP
jgi:hypothetical protein